MEDMMCLFDQNAVKKAYLYELSEKISFRVYSNEEEDPGALQSGIFQWPAGFGLAKFMFAHRE